jgi:hypothetical protein
MTDKSREYACVTVNLNLFVDRFWRADLYKMAVVQHGCDACALLCFSDK